MTTLKSSRFVAVLLSGLLFVVGARAAQITNVNILNVSAQYASIVSGLSDLRRATNLVNGCGLLGDQHTYIAPGSMWLTTTTANSNPGTNFVTFDLGVAQTLGTMRVWNYNLNTATNQGVGRADISTAGEDLIFTTNFTDAVFNPAPGFLTNFAQAFDFGGVSARYVRINIRTNLGGGPSVGLSKVLFYNTNLQPAVVTATRNWSNNRIMVTFGESVTAGTATALTNYSILLSGTNAATVSSAAMDTYNNVVFLQTSVLDSNQVYTLQSRNVRSAADNSPIVTNQTVITPELALWLKADAGITESGGLVSQWADQSGNGNHVVQATTANQPSLVLGALNGQPALQFDAAASPNADFLQAAHSSSLVVRNDYSVFAVFQVEGAFWSNPTVFSKTVTVEPSPLEMYVTTAAVLRSYRSNAGGNGGASGRHVGTATFALNTPVVVGNVMRGYNSTIYHNGPVRGVSAGMVSGTLDAGGPLRIGARADATTTTRFRGKIAEVMIFRGAVSDLERASITDYLGAKYGIAVTNLTITTQPVSVTKLEGETATFNVAAVGSGAISYQWQRYGTNLPNATNVSYTTPVLTLADDGAPYAVQVSIPGNILASDAAVLTVLPDNVAPTVVSANRKIWNQSEIVVTFSEPMTPLTTTNAANYMLDNGASVTAVVSNAPNRVTLFTSGVTNGGVYQLTVQNATDLYNNPLVASPVSLGYYPAPLALWLKGDAGLTVDPDGYVSLWEDQSGNANHVFQPGVVNLMPQAVSNAWNGQTIIHFDGTNNYLVANSSGSLAMTSDMAVLMVTKVDDFVNHNGLVGKTPINGIPQPYDYYLQQSTGRPRFYRGNGTTSFFDQVTATTAPSLGVPHLLGVNMAATTVTHFLDGTTNGSGSLSTTITDNGEPFAVGTRGGFTTRMKGGFAEILMFGTALSTSDRQSLENYLASKYSLFLGTAPTLSIAPISAGTVSLSWPVPQVGFDLEARLSLSSPVWTPVTNSISTVSGTNSVTVNAAGSERYFRLKKQ